MAVLCGYSKDSKKKNAVFNVSCQSSENYSARLILTLFIFLHVDV